MTLLAVLHALLLAAAALFVVPCAVLWLELRAARRAPASPPLPAARAPLTVLVPAHDEAHGLANTLRSIAGDMRTGDRLLVVADNCSDDTAGVARREGADVVERHDPAHRGKGHALAFGLRHCDAAPDATIVMLDADCEIARGTLDRLAATLQATRRPVQGRYLMLAAPGATAPQRIAQFAWRLKNALRPQGAAALGWPCLLTGSGMAFRRAQLDAVHLASANIVEDMQLGIDLARAGHAPVFEPGALVTSRFASDARAAAAQRRRWEHGHLATLLREAPRLVAAALRQRRGALLGLALELAVPPLAALALALALLTLAAAGVAAVGGGAAPLVLCGVGLLCFGAALAGGWRQAGRDLLRAAELPLLAGYALRKLPLYLSFIGRRQQQWNRTRREGEREGREHESRARLLGVEFDRLTLAQTVQRIRAAAFARQRLWLSTANVNWVVAAARDDAFAATLRASELCVADGQLLVWLSRWLGQRLPERVAGADLFEALAQQQAEPAPLRVYFFGGPPGAARRAAMALNARGGALRCVGFDSGGWGDIQAMSDAATIDRINAARPHFLVVALGAVKGQRWIAHNRERLQVPVVSHLGAVVNFAAGDLERAPHWMRRAGLEWAWRIKEEPALARRYASDAWGLVRLLWRHHGGAARARA